MQASSPVFSLYGQLYSKLLRGIDKTGWVVSLEEACLTLYPRCDYEIVPQLLPHINIQTIWIFLVLRECKVRYPSGTLR